MENVIIILVLVLISAMLVFGWQYKHYIRGFIYSFDISEFIPDALLIIDENGKIVSANSNAEKLFGYTKSELYSITVEDLIPVRYREMHVHQRKHFYSEPHLRPMGMGRDLFILKKDGTEVPAEIALSPTCEIACMRYGRHKTVVLLHDITTRKQAEQTIYNLAYVDQLTGLPNRIAFYEQSANIIKTAIAHKNKLAFIILDIRNLKKVNDTLGHYVGDDVIEKTGIMLKKFVDEKSCYRAKNVILYKISGNEFLFLVEYAEDSNCSDKISSKVINLFKHPIKIEGTSLDMYININLGISVLPIHGMSTSQLLKTADMALIKSKQMGMNVFCYYNDAMSMEFNNFTLYENAIKYFIKTNNFNLSFQPVWNLKKDKYVGAEVLFRCNEDQYPGMHVEFLINVAESTGLIIPLGAAILEKACIESKEYGLLCDEIGISINASMQQLEDTNFTSIVKNLLKKYDIMPKHMAIEITETTLMNQEAQVIKKVEELREHGIRIYIDDFGKGFSSLTQLNKMPADKLKIDMSFLEGLHDNKATLEILRGIIDLGHAIELIVCTEGVETESQFNILKEMGCDEIQGFYKGKPTPGNMLKLEYKDMYENCTNNG